MLHRRKAALPCQHTLIFFDLTKATGIPILYLPLECATQVEIPRTRYQKSCATQSAYPAEDKAPQETLISFSMKEGRGWSTTLQHGISQQTFATQMLLELGHCYTQKQTLPSSPLLDIVFLKVILFS